MPTSDVICITAGLRRKPDESRLDLINRNVDLFLGILGEIKKAGTKQDAIVLVVSNPVDVLTYLAAERLKLPPTQVHRPGHAARHDPLPQPDRREAGRAADAGDGPDPGRARRQHGADLVERHDRRACRWRNIPAGRSTLADEAVHPHQGLGRRSDQEEGRRRLRRRHGDSGSDRGDRARSATACCRSPACKTAATAFATWRSRCPPSSAAAAWWPRTRSSCGRRRCKGCSRVRQVLRQTIDTVLDADRNGEADGSACNAKISRSQNWPPSTPIRRAAQEFILADAKDADMAFGIGAPGRRPRRTPARCASARWPSIASRFARSSSKGWSISC